MSKNEVINITLKANMDIGDIKSKTSAIQGTLSKLKLSDSMSGKFDKLFSGLDTELSKVQEKMNSAFKTKSDVTGFEKSVNKVASMFTELNQEISKIGDKDLRNSLTLDTTEIQRAKERVSELQKEISKKIDTSGFKEVEKAINDMASKSKFKTDFGTAFKLGDVEGAKAALGGLLQNLKTFTATSDEMKAKIGTIFDDLINGDSQKAEQAFADLRVEIDKLDGADGLKSTAANMEILFSKFNELKKVDLNTLRVELEKAGIEVQNLSKAQLDKLAQEIKDAAAQSKGLEQGLRQSGNAAVAAADDMYSLNNQMNQIKNRVQDFFSLTNSVLLFRRAVQSAFETVKELDAAMTETAVVTDFNVGDMWDQLPRYTQAANDLGTTTLGAYETMTLFYQQGLKTNEVFEIGTETMKMARIAGLEYKDATDLMTAALRGFNMELNETSAARVNDVYSELAAITAADTQEIATAMTKTASIAANANMEFETTAAFLSQIIETTREPAETAGTAMKTIIARFTEMKKAESDLINIDGEVVSVNKVEAALKTAGVALRDFNGEFRDTDDVFLELASKWNGLDKMTQRYIATMAAGSRQQSRFIAMMSDYDRTVELVDAAYSSTGASQIQFAKTQESLESKINKLKNAWDEFAMGLMNSSLVKFGVDLLTGLLKVINKVTGVMGDGIGTVLKLASAFAALRIGNTVFTSLLKTFTPFASLMTDTQKKSTGNFLDNARKRIANFKETGSFSLKKEVELDAPMDASQQLVVDSQTSGNILKESSREAGEIFKKAVNEAGAISKKDEIDGAREEGNIEKTDAKLEGQQEISDAIKEGQVENKELSFKGKSSESSQDIDLDVDDIDEINAKEKIDIDVDADGVDEIVEDLDDIPKKGKKAAKAMDNVSDGVKTVDKVADGLEVVDKVDDVVDVVDDVGDGLKAVDKVDDIAGSWKNGFSQMGKNATQSISKVMGSLGYLAPILAGVLATAGAIAAIWAIAWYTSPIQEAKREVESLSNASNKAAESVQHIGSAISNLKQGHSALQQLKKDLTNLIPGTEEYYAKIDEINSATGELLKKNPNLQLQMSSAPFAEINEESYQKSLEDLEQKQKNAIGAQSMINADLATEEKKLKKLEELDDLEKEVKTNEWANGFWATLGGIGGGLAGIIGGALTGGLAGAEVGAIAGGVGAIPGAVVGALTGAITGLVGGAGSAGYAAYDKSRENQAKDTEEYQEREAVLNYEIAIQERTQDMQYKTAIAQGLGDNISQGNKMAVSNALLTNLETRKEDELKEIKKGSNKANQEEIEEWAERSGYTVRNKKVYDTEGNEVDISDKKAIADQLAYMRALEKTQLDAEVIENSLGDTSSNIKDILAGDLSADIDADDLAKNYGKEGVSKIQKEFEDSLKGKTTDQQKEILAAYLGIDPEEIDDKEIQNYVNEVSLLLEQKAAELEQQKIEQDVALQIDMQTLIGGNLEGKKAFSKKISNKFGIEGMQELQNFRNLLEDNFNEDLAREMTLTFATSGEDVEVISEAMKEIGQVNLSNPVQGFKELKALTESENELLANTAKQLLETSNFSTQNQFKQVYSSLSSDTDLSKALKKGMDDGRITASEVGELGQSYKELGDFLDNTGISVSTFASVLTKLEDGSISLDGLTDSVLEAISALTSFEDSLDLSEKAIEDFKKTAKDSMKNVDELDSIGDDFNEMLENKEYGNLAVTRTIEFMYGEDAFSDVEDNNQDYINFLNEKQKEIEQWNSYGGMGFFKDLANDPDFKDVSYGAQGNIEFDIGEKTEKEIVTSLAKAKGISEEAARVYWEAYVSHSPDAQRKVNENNKRAAKEAFITDKIQQSDQSIIGVDGTVTATKQELETLASELEMEYEDLVAELKGIVGEDKIDIIDWESMENMTPEAISKKIQDLSGLDVNGLTAQFNIGTENEKIIDYEAIKSELMDVYKLSEEQANQVIDNVASESGAKVGQAIATGFYDMGNPITEMVVESDVSSLTNKVNSALGQTQSFGEMLANQNYQGIADVLTQIINEMGSLWWQNLWTGVKNALSYVYAAGIFLVKGIEEAAKSIPGGEDPMSASEVWEYSINKAKLDFDITDPKNPNDPNDGSGQTRDERYKNMGYSSGWQYDVPGIDDSKVTGKYSKVDGTVEYKDEKTGYKKTSKTHYYTWLDENGKEQSYQRQIETYYDDKGNVITAEQYANKTQITVNGYVPPKNEDEEDKGKDSTKEENDTVSSVENIDADLRALDRALENREINEVEYWEEKNNLLSQKTAAYEIERNRLEGQAQYLNRYYYYDEEKEEYKYIEDAFNALSAEEKNKVDKEMDEFQEIQEGIHEVADEIRDKEFKTPELEKQYYEGLYGSENAQTNIEDIERRRGYNDRERNIVGKLPEEIQDPLNLALLGKDMGLEIEEIQRQKEQREGVLQQIAAKEGDADFLGSYYTYDELTNTYKINEAKLANPSLNKETRDAIYEEYEELQGLRQEQNRLDDELYGGFIQDSVKNFGKVLDGAADAAKGDKKASEKLDKAFDELEKQLGLDENALDNFAQKLKEAAESSEFMKKEFEGFGIEGIEEKLQETSFDDETKTGLSKILGKGTFTGADFTDTMGGVLGTIGDYLNFDNIELGLDIFNGTKDMVSGFFEKGKNIVDQIKGKIEELVGYITQATQVIIDAWTNREDYLYNFLKVIEKHLQEYEKLQREDNQFQKGRTASVEDIKRNWNEQWKSLQTQLEEQQERLETRQDELNRSRWNPFQLISGWDPTSDTLYENREVKFLWDVIIGLGEAFAPFGTGAFFSQLNQLYEDYDERVQNSYEDRLAAEQAILDIEDQRLELVKAGAEEATQFEQKVLDALIQKEQEQIDELTRLNDSITEANSKLISTLQNNLEKIRQDRENEKKEEELGEKERRLAYLRQDTSGANMMEIKKLEEELEEGHEDYTDTLIDQKISELQEQNDKAAEQRQQQIELLQAQLEWNEKYGLYWDTIYGMLYTFDENGNVILKPENFDIDGNIRENSELAKMLDTFSDRIGMSTWSAVLDSEELKLLGKYYGAFVGVNGVDGNWKNRWALDDPGADDPNYAYPEQEIPEGVWGVLYSMEIMFKKYFVNSNLGLANGIGRIDEAFKNAFGKLFGNEELANYNFEGYKAEQVQSTFFAGLKKAGDDAAEWFAKAFSKNSNSAKNLAFNTGGSQNYGDTNINNTFTIGTVGESISLDDMVDKVSNAIKGMFTSPINSLQRSR